MTHARSFQARVGDWMAACFTPEVAADKTERNHRFLEEALELVQSLGCTASEAHQLVAYTFHRPQGDVNQELGGVMVTLAALCLASDLDMNDGAEKELARIWKMIITIRAKQERKPKHRPQAIWDGFERAKDVVADFCEGRANNLNDREALKLAELISKAIAETAWTTASNLQEFIEATKVWAKEYDEGPGPEYNPGYRYDQALERFRSALSSVASLKDEAT